MQIGFWSKWLDGILKYDREVRESGSRLGQTMIDFESSEKFKSCSDQAYSMD